MTTSDSETAPMRGVPHEARAAFLGQWRAKGTSYGRPNQPVDDPKRAADPWGSTHSGTWHTGASFRIQDEQATVASIDRVVSSTCLRIDQAAAATRLALIPFPGRNAR